MSTILSIIVPVYNTPQEFLTKSLNSLHRQDFSAAEFIIVNDGATEPWVEETILEFSQKDNRFKYIKKEHSGTGATRNRGMEVCQGKYLMFVDSDDILLEGSCRYAVDSIESTNCDIVLFGQCTSPKQQLHPIKKILSTEEIIDLKYSTLAFSPKYEDMDLVVDGVCAKIFRKDIIEDHHLCFHDLRRSEDALFCLHYYDHCSSICFDNEIIYVYCFNPESTMNKFSDNSVKALPSVLEEKERYVYQDAAHQHYYAKALPERAAKGIKEGLDYYFLHWNNKKKINTLAKELKAFITTPIVNKYFKDSTTPSGRKIKLYWCLLRLGLYRPVFIAERFFRLLNAKMS